MAFLIFSLFEYTSQALSLQGHPFYPANWFDLKIFLLLNFFQGRPKVVEFLPQEL
jgi:hypothetical protein